MALATVVSRAAGAALRAALMACVVALPQVMLGGGSVGATPTVALFALLAAAFTASEYAAPAPSLIEFRDAPPYNRLRVLSALGTMAALGVMLGEAAGSATPALILRALGDRLGEGLDFPYSPVRLMLLMLPAGGAGMEAPLRVAAAVAYAASLAMVAAFALSIRLGAWPRARPGALGFNVWVNLPQFDPTAGGDVVERLRHDAQVNLSLGVALPFIVPMVVELVSGSFDRVVFGHPAAMIWTVTAWAFLPAGLVMRGVALTRVARMIAAQRARATQAAGALQTA